MNKVAIITGASSGIGKATTSALLKTGYKVYAGSRRIELMTDISDQGAVVQSLDLTNEESIKNFVSTILESENSIDVLINNAGYGSYGAIEDIPMDEARRQFEVNLFGLAMITNLCLPTMRNQKFGKIVHIGSIGGKLWSILGGWYQATKFALEGFSDCTRNELKPFGIDVILVEPGAIKSEWSDIMRENLNNMSGNGPYKPITKAALKAYEDAKSMEVEASIVARTILKAVSATKPKARYVVPRAARMMLFLRWLLNDRMFDALWRRFMRVPKSID